MRSVAVHGALARGTFAAVVLVSLAVLFAPGPEVPSTPPGVDKVVHLLLFTALAVSGRWAGVGARALGPVLAMYAGVSEVIQGLAPLQRDASVGDWLADSAGILLGLGLWAWLTRARR
jgi:hypothetical protein